MQVADVAGRTVVTVAGELDIHSAPALASQLDPCTKVDHALVIVDLSGVTFMDSTGLGVLVSALKHVREHEGTLDVVVSEPRVLKVLALTGLDVVIPLHASLEEAMASS